MPPVIQVTELCKTYASGFVALRNINLTIQKGEIFALLGPNGAGKTSLIGIVCGLVNASSGQVMAGGHDIVRDAFQARALIGLVPQELFSIGYETVWDATRFTRRLFGKTANDEYIAGLLKSLSLWDKKDSRILELSGGMKRRVMIAKALSHEPDILFLDEPTAGVDVALRRDMWTLIRSLRDRGVTIILTTHYIEEAEEMADRIGVINRGELVLVEDKRALMRRFGAKQLTLQLFEPLAAIPPSLSDFALALSADGLELSLTYDAQGQRAEVAQLIQKLNALQIPFKDLQTHQLSLEDIFVKIIRDSK